MSTVTLQIINNVAYLTINRAEKRNALSQSMWQQIADFCDELTRQVSVKVLVVKAAGNKAFCAGADIEELTQFLTDKTQLMANNKIVQLAQQKLEQLTIPTVAAINGVCVGGGLGLAMCCDFRISVNHAKFAITPAKLGLLYSIEDTKRLVDIVGLSRSKELLYLGKTISAQTAEQWGLLTDVVDEDQLDASVELLVTSLLSVSRNSIAGIKSTLAYIHSSSTVDEESVRQVFNDAFNHQDFKEGADAFLQKRKADFK
ncbi:enoyl-CoA hydratase/isomerase family protein [Pseudocolwellia agarivorans]|uniref:enoyl-CoA hydratase/isomerase family protein n=1 Tax=Pseudocolwellia agarivorans TaxID=1911682 RepID=UPI00098523B9|nr:enoyl-CoA hydratase/isomerase family protein [Pseudocolwellia agarivorans]